jgi:hypothetical protein
VRFTLDSIPNVLCAMMLHRFMQFILVTHSANKHSGDLVNE